MLKLAFALTFFFFFFFAKKSVGCAPAIHSLNCGGHNATLSIPKTSLLSSSHLIHRLNFLHSLPKLKEENWNCNLPVCYKSQPHGVPDCRVCRLHGFPFCKQLLIECRSSLGSALRLYPGFSLFASSHSFFSYRARILKSGLEYIDEAVPILNIE